LSVVEYRGRALSWVDRGANGEDVQTEESSRIPFDLEDCPYLDSGGLSVLLFSGSNEALIALDG
jgi:hypothetical protein